MFTFSYLIRIHTVTFLPFRAYNTDNQLIIDTYIEGGCGASNGRKSSKRTVISNDFIIIHQRLQIMGVTEVSFSYFAAVKRHFTMNNLQ